jgi:hypothetical protein
MFTAKHYITKGLIKPLLNSNINSIKPFRFVTATPMRLFSDYNDGGYNARSNDRRGGGDYNDRYSQGSSRGGYGRDEPSAMESAD